LEPTHSALSQFIHNRSLSLILSSLSVGGLVEAKGPWLEPDQGLADIGRRRVVGGDMGMICKPAALVGAA
jgi:hypothetical protein